jgi:7-keto-8-aminopelargonate synthetase-like enzyme
LRILKEHPELPETLQSRALFMRKKLQESNIRMKDTNGDRIPIIPIYTYKPITTLTIAKELYDRGVYVNPSLPPATAPDECLLRTSLMATHTEEQIEKAVAIIAEVLHKHKIGI